uniref:Uncharacterized protein n=1 Tax=Piliocolobus tephrosceles TaxID=591936 RepID=A0A8C9IKL3_9PRIM
MQTIHRLTYASLRSCAFRKLMVKIVYGGQMRWLKPVIPALWEAKAGRSSEPRNLRPAWPTW